MCKCLQVWLVAYRQFASLASATTPTPAALKGAPELDIPACSNPSMETLVDAYKPCSPIASVSNQTRARVVEGLQVHEVKLNVYATIRPGMDGLRAMDAECQYTNLFGLASTTAELYLVAQDVGATNAGVAVQCGSTDAAQAGDANIFTRACGCALHALRHTKGSLALQSTDQHGCCGLPVCSANSHNALHLLLCMKAGMIVS